jgi:transglutaminase-like putative cysteine protease
MTRSAPPTERRFAAGATVALAGVTASVAVGLGRLFTDTSFLAPVLIVAVVTHLSAWGGRRLGWGAVPAIVASLVAGTLTIVMMRYGSASTVGLPNGAVLDRLGTDLADAWTVFQEEGAPVPVVDGFVVTAMAAMVAIAVAADALAFRLGAPLEALAPAGGLFLFTTVLSGPDHRITATLLFVAAALAFVLADRVARRAGAGTWLAAPRGRGAGALLRSGAALAAVAVVGGLLIGPVLPGADADPIIDLDADGDEGRVTISPLVEIQSRLVDQSDVEVFTVRSNERAYWRMTALDEFDGEVWSAGGEYVGATGPLPRPVPDLSPERRQIRQEFEIGALADIWLPAAYEPDSIDAGDIGVEWNAASSSLVVDPDRRSSDDLRYEVVSAAPIIDPATAAAADTAGSDLDDLRRLPADFSPGAVQVAEDVTSGVQSPYEQARALQQFFREDFEYSLDIPPGHGVADIDAFLTGRIGYCEQFAGTFAALARSVGLPSRVAVGFTPGEADVEDPTLFHVRGEHAHAWPEVHLEGLGWVAFEPTPGRGAPGGEAHTGVAEQQAGEQAPGVPTPTTTTSSPTTPAPGAAATAPTAPDAAAPAEAPAGTDEAGPNWRLIVMIGLAGLGLAWLLGVPALVVLRRDQARRRAAGTPADEVAVAWAEAVDSLDRAGLHRRAAETPRAYGTRVGRSMASDTGRALADLAIAVTTLWFGGREQVDAVMATTSREASVMLATAARRRVGPRRWWLSGLDPRRLTGPGPQPPIG